MEAARHCANCGRTLAGEYCSHCGQRDLNLHRPIADLFSDVVGDVFNLDTRLVRTLRPLMLKPGEVARDYIAGRRAAHVPPLKSYLIAALVFFTLFTIFPNRASVSVFIEGSPAEAAAKSRPGGKVSFSLPAHVSYNDDWYQKAAARAMQQPDAFAQKVYENLPRAFFVLLPLFALFLEVFYRKQGYLFDHLVFSLYYHAFVFLNFTLVFLASRVNPVLPGPVRLVIGLALYGWLFAYLPIALRRVYGGSRWLTGAKVLGLGVLYLVAFGSSMPLVIGAALLEF